MTEQRCNRYDCALFNKNMANGCDGLIDLPKHLKECKFYKTFELMETQKKEQQERMQNDIVYRSLCVCYGIKFKGEWRKPIRNRGLKK